jgi:hypothetical protein
MRGSLLRAARRDRQSHLALRARRLRRPRHHDTAIEDHDQTHFIGQTPIRLAARGSKPRSGGGDLVGVHRDHGQPSGQQTVDQQPVRTLDRDALHSQRHQPPAHVSDPVFVMANDRGPQTRAVGIADQDSVIVLGPVNARAHHSFGHRSSTRSARLIAGSELPLRMLIDGPSPGLRPVAACGSSLRRERQVSSWPSQRQASEALSRRQPAARPYPGRDDREVDL